MKTPIYSIIGRLIAYLAVLAFVFGIVYMTQNTAYLWLLLLILTVDYVPTYEEKRIYKNNNDKEKKKDKDNDDPFGGEYE